MMNAKNHSIEIYCDPRQATDVAKAVIHSIVFFRSFGKFTYKHESSYSIGTLGFEEVECQNIDFTYIRCSNIELASTIDSTLQELGDNLRENVGHAILLLEFYIKKPNRWPFNESKIVWESWTLKLIFNQHRICPHDHFDRRYQARGSIEDTLSMKMIDIVTVINKEKSLPQMPTQSNFDNVFDSAYIDLQPYLFSLSWKICDNLDEQLSEHSPKDISIENSDPRRSSLTKFLLGTLEL